MSGRRSTAQASAFVRFAADAASTSPLHERVAGALSRSAEALAVLEALPAGARHPAFVLAALHDLALAGRAPALAAAYADGDGDAAADAAVDTLLRMHDHVRTLAGRRSTRTTRRDTAAVLCPAVAEAARRVGAEAVGLVDLGFSGGLSLLLDRVAVSYDDGQVLGDPASPVRSSCRVVGGPVPARPVPEVVARIGVGHDPPDVTDADDVRWLRARLAPDQRAEGARLDAELALAAGAPPLLVRGDAADVLPKAVSRVPPGALPVVMTTWALSSSNADARLHLLRRVFEAAAGRTVAWVSVEGVGVAPAVPTLGDRPASGHSIVGVAVVEHAALRVEAVGRCWSRGRWLAWLADP